MTPDLDLARRFLAAQGAPGALLAGVTGAHYYGFPSPDSDLDLKGIHVAPTAAVVSLSPPEEHQDYLGLFDGVEIDYTSHELGVALRLLLKGNGNMLERILSPYQALCSPAATELQALAGAAASKRFFHHYRGFFARMRQDVAATERPTAKGLLYSYRSALTGIHLLLTGECVGDVCALAPQHGFTAVPGLVEHKRSGTEHGALPDPERFIADWPRLEAALQDAFDRSPLPEQAANSAALSDFLVRQRRQRFD
jgi:hypothetical protein